MVAELKLEDFGSVWLRVAVAESVIKVSEKSLKDMLRFKKKIFSLKFREKGNVILTNNSK